MYRWGTDSFKLNLLLRIKSFFCYNRTILNWTENNKKSADGNINGKRPVFNQKNVNINVRQLVQCEQKMSSVE